MFLFLLHIKNLETHKRFDVDDFKTAGKNNKTVFHGCYSSSQSLKRPYY